MLFGYLSVNLCFMSRLRKDVGILRNLVTFDVASRTQSFTGAAQELGISRVAVSRQIADLEQSLGLSLFVRKHRKVVLTTAGEAFSTSINPALEQIADGIARQRLSNHSSRLSVTVSSAFATYWLMPRLADFSTRHPNIEINLVVSDRYLDLVAEGIDLAIRYAPPSMATAKWQLFINESIVPVFSPNYTANTALNNANDLLSERLLHLSGHYRAEATWGYWFRQRGMEPPEERRGIQVNTYLNMLQAAIEGQGVALAGHPLIDRYLHDGTLIKVPNIEPSLRLAFYIVNLSEGTAATTFCAWLQTQV